MKKKSKAAAEPTLVFYKKVEWEQMAFRRRREEIMVAVSVLLLCVLTIFGWAAVGIGVMCGVCRPPAFVIGESDSSRFPGRRYSDSSRFPGKRYSESSCTAHITETGI